MKKVLQYSHSLLHAPIISPYAVFLSECDSLLAFCLPQSDSDSSLLRFLSDDRIVLIQEEAEFSQRDTSRRSRKKSRNPSSPSFPISPSMLAPPVRLDTGPPEGLPFPVPDSNTMPHYHVSEMLNLIRAVFNYCVLTFKLII